jgi:hypothetical protein
MTASTHKNVFTALCAARGMMSPAKKTSTNPAFKSRYADLASVFDAVIPALNANGITLLHILRIDVMDTVLVHGETDTSITCTVPLIVAKHDMQGMKSATTYAKRIGTESLCAIAPEDDDGIDAAKAPPPAKAPPARVNPNQFIQLRDLIVETNTPQDKLLEHYKVDLLEELTVDQYADAMRKLAPRAMAKSINDASHEGEM